MLRIHDGERTHDCRIIDLSLRGFRARCPSGWLPEGGARFEVEWSVAEVIKLDLNAEVIRVRNGVIGCQWEPQDKESSVHLQRMIEISRLRKPARERRLEALKAQK